MRLHSIALLTLVSLLVMTLPLQGQSASDGWITTQVKTMLLVSPTVNGTTLHVDSTEGRVTIFGTVGSDAERTDAERIARQVPGVRAVRNLASVVPPAERTSVEIADETIEANIVTALRDDAALATTGIRVESVDAGAVVLGGKARSARELLRAVQVARGVAGVRRVASVVETPEPGALGETGDGDERLTVEVKMRLLADERVPAENVAVDTTRGEVTLFGTVPTEAARRAAEHVAAGVSGVRKVSNQLLVRDS
jgi:hyperosmotically inducible protein